MGAMTFDHPNSGKQAHPLEVAEQKAAWAWLGTRLICATTQAHVKPLYLQDYAYMVPNGVQLAGGGARRAIYMNSLKAQGFRTGVSDLVIAYPLRRPYNKHRDGGREVYHGAYIEMKRVREAYSGPAAVKAAVRPEQKEWLARMYSVGYWVAVAYGAEEFKEVVNFYLAGKSPPTLDFLPR